MMVSQSPRIFEAITDDLYSKTYVKTWKLKDFAFG